MISHVKNRVLQQRNGDIGVPESPHSSKEANKENLAPNTNPGKEEFSIQKKQTLQRFLRGVIKDMEQIPCDFVSETKNLSDRFYQKDMNLFEIKQMMWDCRETLLKFKQRIEIKEQQLTNDYNGLCNNLDLSSACLNVPEIQQKSSEKVHRPVKNTGTQTIRILSCKEKRELIPNCDLNITSSNNEGKFKEKGPGNEEKEPTGAILPCSNSIAEKLGESSENESQLSETTDETSLENAEEEVAKSAIISDSKEGKQDTDKEKETASWLLSLDSTIEKETPAQDEESDADSSENEMEEQEEIALTLDSSLHVVEIELETNTEDDEFTDPSFLRNLSSKEHDYAKGDENFSYRNFFLGNSSFGRSTETINEDVESARLETKQKDEDTTIPPSLDSMDEMQREIITKEEKAELRRITEKEQLENEMEKNKELILELLNSDSDDETEKKNGDENEEASSDSSGEENIRQTSGSSSSDDELSNTELMEKSASKRKKKTKFKLKDNEYYLSDAKSRERCYVIVNKLGNSELEVHSKALEESEEYLADKKLKRLLSLSNVHPKNRTIISDSDSSDSVMRAKRKKPKIQEEEEEEETLLDCMDSMSDSRTTTEVLETVEKELEILTNDQLFEQADIIAQEQLLKSGDSDHSSGSEMDEADDEENDDNDVASKKKANDTENKKKTFISKEMISTDDSDKSSKEDDEKREKSKWKKDRLLTARIIDSSDESNVKNIENSKEKMQEKLERSTVKINEKESTPMKRKKPHQKRRVSNSDDDFVASLPTKKKMKRGSSRDASSDSNSDDENQQSSQEAAPNGRKNIRAVISDKSVAKDTKQAVTEETKRRKRIAKRQKLYKKMYGTELKEKAKVDTLILDFDKNTKKELVRVDDAFVQKLKPHQAQGVKFMWDACFESLERAKSAKGSGCIIAHCMGLGKTFQVIALAHTLLNYKETGVKTIMIVCPLGIVLNWVNEFKIWLPLVEDSDNIEIYELTKMKTAHDRNFLLQHWQKTGGILIIGYDLLKILTTGNKKNKTDESIQESFLSCLADPGPDLVVCDEGHLLKNENTGLSKAMRQIQTQRRIVLTGTPLQNNLIEYHCMMQFVKPNLLGSKNEFTNRFVNPIKNGQCKDSTPSDVLLMKKRAHVLYKMLEDCVQRFGYSHLMPFLPPKQEYVIFVKLTDVQVKMYKHYIENITRFNRGLGCKLFSDYQVLERIWTHPIVLHLHAEKIKIIKQRAEAKTQQLLEKFLDDINLGPSKSIDENDSSSVTKTQPDALRDNSDPMLKDFNSGDEWWKEMVKDEHFEDMKVSTKLVLLFAILKECEEIGEKLLVFSQSLYTLTLIEKFLARIDEGTSSDDESELLNNHTGTWKFGKDYFRLDGQTSAGNRSYWCDLFNEESNTRARLFLISTKAGSLGINMTGANRVIIFDASWNPSHDVQSIFRVYRFGQTKPCFIYRFLAFGTMEEKIYNRQVTKLSLSCRVVDKQQIERHYTGHNLAELYSFDTPPEDFAPTLNCPKDHLLAEIITNYRDAIVNIHEHDSLFENKEDEALDEEQRRQAWQEFEEDKTCKKKRRSNPSYKTEPDEFPCPSNDTDPEASSTSLHGNIVSENWDNLTTQEEVVKPGSSSELSSDLDFDASSSKIVYTNRASLLKE